MIDYKHIPAEEEESILDGVLSLIALVSVIALGTMLLWGLV